MNTKNKECTAYKNKLQYIKEYNKINFKAFNFKLNKVKDKELIDFIDSKHNLPQLIRELYENYKRSYK